LVFQIIFRSTSHSYILGQTLHGPKVESFTKPNRSCQINKIRNVFGGFSFYYWNIFDSYDISLLLRFFISKLFINNALNLKLIYRKYSHFLILLFQLRLPVLIIESVLAYFVTVLNTCRIITNFLILSNSPRVCDEIFLDPILEDSDSNHESSTRFLIRVQNTKSIWRFPRLGPIITKLIQDIIRGKVLN